MRTKNQSANEGPPLMTTPPEAASQLPFAIAQTWSVSVSKEDMYDQGELNLLISDGIHGREEPFSTDIGPRRKLFLPCKLFYTQGKSHLRTKDCELLLIVSGPDLGQGQVPEVVLLGCLVGALPGLLALHSYLSPSSDHTVSTLQVMHSYSLNVKQLHVSCSAELVMLC